MNPFKPGDIIKAYAAPALSANMVIAKVDYIEGDKLFITIADDFETIEGRNQIVINYRQARKENKRKW